MKTTVKVTTIKQLMQLHNNKNGYFFIASQKVGDKNITERGRVTLKEFDLFATDDQFNLFTGNINYNIYHATIDN